MERDNDGLEPAEGAGEAAVVAVAGLANPLAGVLAAVGFGVKEAVTIRRWKRAVAEALTETGKLLDPEDPLTVAVSTKLTLAAAQTAEEEKLQLLVNALLNSGPDGLEIDVLQEHFADLIARLSATHVRVLAAVRDHNDIRLDLTHLSVDSLLRALEAGSGGEVDPDVGLILETVWQQLTAEDLVESSAMWASGGLEAEPSRGHQVNGITPKGRRFLEYVTRHPNVASTGKSDGTPNQAGSFCASI